MRDPVFRLVCTGIDVPTYGLSLRLHQLLEHLDIWTPPVIGPDVQPDLQAYRPCPVLHQPHRALLIKVLASQVPDIWVGLKAERWAVAAHRAEQVRMVERQRQRAKPSAGQAANRPGFCGWYRPVCRINGWHNLVRQIVGPAGTVTQIREVRSLAAIGHDDNHRLDLTCPDQL